MDQVLTTQEHLQPMVRRYLSVTAYLQDYYKFRRAIQPKFSYEEWAGELGFKSRTYLRFLCEGKRTLTADFIDIFSKKINLANADKEHLILLSLYDQAKDFEYKNIYLPKILSSLICNESAIEAKHYIQFLSYPDLPVIHLLLAVNDLKATAEKVADLLDESLEHVQSRLKILEQMGLAYSQGGVWFSKTKSFKIKDESRGQAVSIFNKETLQEAQSFVLRNDVAKRFRSIYFAFNEDNMSEIDKEIENFLSLLKNKYLTPKFENDRYFKLNLQFYPVTQKLKIKQF
ncbi:MAG: TIGR02147 family protein [Bdellovibrionota bacterium]